MFFVGISGDGEGVGTEGSLMCGGMFGNVADGATSPLFFVTSYEAPTEFIQREEGLGKRG